MSTRKTVAVIPLSVAHATPMHLVRVITGSAPLLSQERGTADNTYKKVDN